MKQAMIDEETLAQINGPYVCPRDAGPEWRAACEYGLDMSLVEDALSKTPEERLETHQRTRNLILALKEEANHVSTAADEDLVIRLRTHRVEFALIGDVCGMLHGAPLVTFGLELCCPFSIENLRRIEAAVKDLHPRHRLTTNKLPLEITDSLASRLKNLYLRTDFGILDCLSEVAGVGRYDQVLQRSVVHKTSYGEFRMLDIDALIAAKEAVGRERDLAAVAQLRAIKEARERPES